MRCKYEKHSAQSVTCSWPKRSMTEEGCLGIKMCTYQPALDAKWLIALKEKPEKSEHHSRGDLNGVVPRVSYDVDYKCNEINLDGDFTIHQLRLIIEHMEKHHEEKC